MRYPEPESATLEYKREIPANDQIIKTTIGFCNQFGGRLLLGVDSLGEVVGLAEELIDSLLEYLEKSIFESTHPPIIPRIYSQRFGDKTILIVEVAEGMAKPYFRTSEGMERGTYLRIGRSTVRATIPLIEELRWQARGIDFEALTQPGSELEDLDERFIQQFLDSRRIQARAILSEELLFNYQLLRHERGKAVPTHAGLLLFGRHPQRWLSEAMILCSHFRGTTGRDSLASVDCEGTLVHQYQQSYDFVVKRLYRAFQIRNSQRDERLELPEVAVREALLNAIVHRNYHIKGPTKIAIYDDRVEIFSPGGFPAPILPHRLEAGMTYLRNPAICRVFREWGYVEKLGSGLIAILHSYREYRLPVPQIIDGGDYVKVILPRPGREEKPLATLPVEDNELLDRLFIQSLEISLHDVQTILAVSRATASRTMTRFVLHGKVERLGQTRSVRFRRRMSGEGSLS